MRLNYQRLDVFTKNSLAGNPLMVVMKADDLDDQQMQSIAREFNTSETVFLMKPKHDGHAASIRIYTPAAELPFAGHPTVGAAVVLGMQTRASAVRIEERIGLITCVIERLDRHLGHARFGLPQLPEPAGKAPDRLSIAGTLGIDPDDIGCGLYQPAVYTAGVIYYLIPVRNSGVLKRLKLERRGWDDIYPLGHGSVFVFTETPEEPDNQFAARAFAPSLGIPEDPATGSAAAALIGLVGQQAGPGQTEYTLRQGHEMGRPSRISLFIRKDGETVTHGGIGGNAVIVGEGWLEIDD